MELPKRVRYLSYGDALPYEMEYEGLIDYKHNHHNITVGGVQDPPQLEASYLHPYAQHWIAVDPATRVLGVLQLQRVFTGDIPFPGVTLRITEFVLFGDLSPGSERRVSYGLLKTALDRLPTGHRLQIYTPLHCGLMALFPPFELRTTLLYSSKPAQLKACKACRGNVPVRRSGLGPSLRSRTQSSQHPCALHPPRV